VCQTLSKSRSLAGARLGFGAGCKALVQDLNTIKYSTNPYNINRMTMAAGIGALSDTAYFEENCKKIIAVREKTSAALRQLGFTVTDSRSNFLLAAYPKLSGQALYLSLKDKGVLVRHFETELLKDYNRITIGNEDQMDTFLAILKAILEEAT
ncbi:MAG: aminotransferase class I/II-fold pyridoxal phosphate-dependent enzyme, partial [Clostridia bacterium]|nr:aminotransferase class I/II-fold pyridoxal phosphate-dependent enzyme [Clostridia bacterium]